MEEFFKLQYEILHTTHTRARARAHTHTKFARFRMQEQTNKTNKIYEKYSFILVNYSRVQNQSVRKSPTNYSYIYKKSQVQLIYAKFAIVPRRINDERLLLVNLTEQIQFVDTCCERLRYDIALWRVGSAELHRSFGIAICSLLYDDRW